MVSGSDINATVGQAAPKSALVGLGKLGATVDINTKAIEMDTLALQDADRNPAESFPVTHIAPLDVTLTPEGIHCIIKAGS